MHEPVAEVGEWIRRVLNGFYQYHAVPGNWAALQRFRTRIGATGSECSQGAANGDDSPRSGRLDTFNAGFPGPGWCTLTPEARLTLFIRGRSRMR